VRRKRALLASCFAFAASCAGDVGAPQFAASDCRRIDIIDKDAGAAIVGAEDIAFDAAGRRLIISAYDRRAVEKAAQRDGSTPPEGGVYAVSVSDVFASSEALEAAPLIDRGAVENGLRPHGIDFDPETGVVAFVNRGYVKDDRRWRMTPSLKRLHADGAVTSNIVHCAANDVVAAAGDALVTYDHASCGFGGFLEDVFAQRKSGASFVSGASLANNLGFANGVARGDEALFIAATREKALHIFGARDGRHYHDAVVKTPGAPDNLNAAEDGRVIAALHPSLMRLALNRKLGWGRAPSRIVAVDPDSGAVDLLFDDPSGKLFSAATAGVLTERGLVAGSVTDKGLLVCEARA
jgi:sugar lactone lactonase YvrE